MSRLTLLRNGLIRGAGLALAIVELVAVSAAAEETKTNRIELNLGVRGSKTVTGIIELPQVAQTNVLKLSAWPEGALQFQNDPVIVPPYSFQKFRAFQQNV